MNAKELAKNIGKEATLKVENLYVTVIVEDARTRFGTVDYMVVPKSGGGEQWVSESRLNVEQ